jgi:hypothetical protein
MIITSPPATLHHGEGLEEKTSSPGPFSTVEKGSKKSIILLPTPRGRGVAEGRGEVIQ